MTLHQLCEHSLFPVWLDSVVRGDVLAEEGTRKVLVLCGADPEMFKEIESAFFHLACDRLEAAVDRAIEAFEKALKEIKKEEPES